MSTQVQDLGTKILAASCANAAMAPASIPTQECQKFVTLAEKTLRLKHDELPAFLKDIRAPAPQTKTEQRKQPSTGKNNQEERTATLSPIQSTNYAKTK